MKIVKFVLSTPLWTSAANPTEFIQVDRNQQGILLELVQDKKYGWWRSGGIFIVLLHSGGIGWTALRETMEFHEL